jgi:hypothetical protein
MNPIYQETDENGMTTFHSLYFSRFGDYGDYKLRIYCEGSFVDTEWIHVESSITNVIFIPSARSDMNSSFRFSNVNSFEANFNPTFKISSSSSDYPLKSKHLSIINLLLIS